MTNREQAVFDNKTGFYILAIVTFALGMLATLPGWHIKGHAALWWMLGVSYWPFILLGFMLAIHSPERIKAAIGPLGGLAGFLSFLVFLLTPLSVSLWLTQGIATALR